MRRLHSSHTLRAASRVCRPPMDQGLKPVRNMVPLQGDAWRKATSAVACPPADLGRRFLEQARGPRRSCGLFSISGTAPFAPSFLLLQNGLCRPDLPASIVRSSRSHHQGARRPVGPMPLPPVCCRCYSPRSTRLALDGGSTENRHATNATAMEFRRACRMNRAIARRGVAPRQGGPTPGIYGERFGQQFTAGSRRAQRSRTRKGRR